MKTDSSSESIRNLVELMRHLLKAGPASPEAKAARSGMARDAGDFSSSEDNSAIKAQTSVSNTRSGVSTTFSLPRG